MISKLKKINPNSLRLGISFFWNKSFNIKIQKCSLFLKFIYILSFFFNSIFKKVFKIEILYLNIFIQVHKFLIYLKVYTQNFLYFNFINIYLPLFFSNKLNFKNNFKFLKKKIFLISKIRTKFKYHFKGYKLKFKLLQIFKFKNLKFSNNKILLLFFNIFFFILFKKSISFAFFDNLEIFSLKKKTIILHTLQEYSSVYLKLKLKIKYSIFNFFFILAWLSLFEKNSFFFSKFIAYCLKTRTQKIFFRFLKNFLMEYFRYQKYNIVIQNIFLKGIRIGLFGKIFGRRRSKKLYLNFLKINQQLTSIKYNTINFTYIKSWTYYGAFGIKTWFFF